MWAQYAGPKVASTAADYLRGRAPHFGSGGRLLLAVESRVECKSGVQKCEVPSAECRASVLCAERARGVGGGGREVARAIVC